MPSADFFLASHRTFCENAHLVDRHGLTKSLCQRKRRQSVSQVESDKAADAPDDLADTDLEKTKPSTSGLGISRWNGLLARS
jgi:hypothetical protein